jgi:hypothetical protein
MTQDNRNHPDLDSTINAMRNNEPSAEDVRGASARIFHKLQTTAMEAPPELINGCDDILRLLSPYNAGELSEQRALLVETHLRDCVTCRQAAEGRTTVLQWKQALTTRPARRWSGLAVAAAVIVFALFGFYVNNAYLAVPAGARATLQSLEGVAYQVTPAGDRSVAVGQQLQDGDILRTGAGSHAYVKLSDGSLVEVNERSAFAVKARGKDTTIDLDRGAVIVQAAHRASGHLYVKTPDCRVAVTGTIFGVKSGVKGSRVSVIQGTVEVAHNGNDDVLHAGDQVSTGANMDAVPVADDIAWSQDLPKHLELLAQLKNLQKRLEQVQLPAPRYNSSLLARMPADTLFYASLPNAGQALEDANRILQDQIQQSDTLREWWTHGKPGTNDEWNAMVGKLRQLSDYLGDEVVIAGFGGHQPGVVIAEVRRSGLREFLETKFSDAGKGHKLVVVGLADLSGLPATSDGPIALLRQNEVVFSGDRDSLIKINAQLDAGTKGLEGTEFGQRVAEAYGRGAGFFFAADLQRLMQTGNRRHPHTSEHDAELMRSGLSDMRYLVVEHREINNVPDNRMVLDFAGSRRGVASWLAAPAPMGSLEFVSRNAAVAISFVAKDPQLMVTDIFNMADDPAKAQTKLAEANSKLNLNLRDDLAAQFGGDAVLALDGPVLPTPAWKFVIEIHDANKLAASMQTLVESFNREAQQHGKSGIALKSEDVNGQRFYTVIKNDSQAKPMYYTFSAGYMIIGPDRATLMNTLRTRATEDSLARSGDFKAMLPKDENANYSFIAYQNLAPILQPLLSVVDSRQAKIIQELAADSHPSAICGWGRDSRIEAVSNSRLLGFDWMAVGSLLSRGTNNQQNP